MDKETRKIVDVVEFHLDVIDCMLSPATRAKVLDEVLAEVTEMITMRLLEGEFEK